jgi:predicted membrane chloride channel (bestrophin family)
VFKATLPAILSSCVYLILLSLLDGSHRFLVDPYSMGALIAALTFLLSFRANFSYNRSVLL